MANILALRMSHTRILNNPYLEEISGHRCILAVTGIVAKLQTTVLFGNNLFSVAYGTGASIQSNLDPQTVFGLFLNTYKNRPERWAQLAVIPPPPVPYPAYLLQQNPFPMRPPVSKGTLTLLNAGYDPMRGYWVEFAGNYFLGFPLFQDWAQWVIRDTPNYRGPQGTGAGGSGGAPPNIPPTTC